MKRIGLCLCLMGCQASVDSDVDTAGETELQELGQIQGTITRAVDYQGDGVGHLLVLAFYNIEPQLGLYPVSSLALSYVDLTSDDVEIEYTLTHLFPEPEPYFVAAIFDDDGSVLESGDWEPTAGDLMTAPLEPDTHPPVYVGSGEQVCLDLTLSVVY